MTERRKRKPKSREAIRRWSLKQKFGLTIEQYDQMHAEQHGRCLLCLRLGSELSKRLAVDHDHASGKVRGLLCGPCNVVLGYIENAEWFGRALAYLAKHADKESAA